MSKASVLLTALTLTVATSMTNAAPKHSVSTALLDSYAGTYSYSETAVVHVSRSGDHLTFRMTGESGAGAPIYPQDESTFFFVEFGSDARVEFIGNETAVLRQNGAKTRMPRIDASRAAQIEAQVAQRVAAQTASPLSEAALRRFMDDVVAGRIDKQRLCPQLVGALSKDLPKFQLKLTQLGPPVSVRLKEVGARGNDEYEVVHERGVSQWGTVVDSEGVITSLTMNF